MFGFNRKEPEKPKPDFQGDQHEHKACVIVYDGTKAADRINDFKDQYHR